VIFKSNRADFKRFFLFFKRYTSTVAAKIEYTVEIMSDEIEKNSLFFSGVSA